MMGYWRSLEERERVAVLAAAVVLLLVLAYVFVWDPVHSEVASLRKGVVAQQELSDWMRSAAAEVRRHRSMVSTGGGAGQSLLARVESTARKAGLSKTIKRIQPDGSGRVRIWLEDVPFDDALAWMVAMLDTGSVVTKDLVVERSGAPGMVNVKVVLEGRSG
jgi:general secretion pathway protein M